MSESVVFTELAALFGEASTRLATEDYLEMTNMLNFGNKEVRNIELDTPQLAMVIFWLPFGARVFEHG